MIKKLSPRRVILIAVAFLLLAGVCYVLWPHRFADLQPECDSVTLICMVDKPWRSLRNRDGQHRSWHDVGRCRGALHRSGNQCAEEKQENRGANGR